MDDSNLIITEVETEDGTEKQQNVLQKSNRKKWVVISSVVLLLIGLIAGGILWYEYSLKNGGSNNNNSNSSSQSNHDLNPATNNDASDSDLPTKVDANNPDTFNEMPISDGEFRAVSLQTSVPSVSYNENQAYRMVDMAGATYCGGWLGKGLGSWTCDVCKKHPEITDVKEFDSNFNRDAEGFTAYDTSTKAILVAFAGTDPLSVIDWANDLSTWMVSYPACSSCKVHQGFWETYKAVRTTVWNNVNSLRSKYNTNKVVITGHSLGGAIASHCAMDFYDYLGIEPYGVYTFGSPRVGNSQFSSYYKSRVKNTYRITHQKDMVLYVPFYNWGFRHVPTEYWYPTSSSGSYKKCDGSGEDSDCSRKWSLLPPNIFDHLWYLGFDFTSNYLKCRL